eukprot:CAMPEP_0194118858 /NCGR_PEP_ID=MMETSP0150-20130528/37301_1 /TAXON_ID=122233 /ORGANISM="Chaetoceros debilis, Strain MM31A-1" /LENGTH=196 /DNA_ID=CAMNT_0038810385 /DNA_START=127 /DNA_END=714 /DNA_ORIENTATION=-
MIVSSLHGKAKATINSDDEKNIPFGVDNETHGHSDASIHSSNKDQTKEEKYDTNDEWDLEEDWLLQDQLPLFTVKSTSHISRSRTIGNRANSNVGHSVTFWTQLRHATPSLSYRTEEELECRYCKILHEQKVREDKNTDGHTSRSRSKSKICECGPSAELLTNWSIEEHSSYSGNDPSGGAMMMGGELLNGSRIWF